MALLYQPKDPWHPEYHSGDDRMFPSTALSPTEPHKINTSPHQTRIPSGPPTNQPLHANGCMPHSPNQNHHYGIQFPLISG